MLADENEYVHSSHIGFHSVFLAGGRTRAVQKNAADFFIAIRRVTRPSGNYGIFPLALRFESEMCKGTNFFFFNLQMQNAGRFL